MLKAICAGFEETTEPSVCLSNGRFLMLVLVYREGDDNSYDKSELVSSLLQM